MGDFTTRELIIEVVNKLFVYTDQQQWNKLANEVFTEEVFFDMTSMGGERMMTTGRKICDMWEKGFKTVDVVDHLAGNHVVEVDGEEATVFCYATAIHFKQNAKFGQTRTFVGSYNIHLTLSKNGWKIDRFTYNLKFAYGNVDLV